MYTVSNAAALCEVSSHGCGGVVLSLEQCSNQYWRDRAEEVRASAEATHDPVARQTLLNIAKEYKKLAERAARCAQVE